MFFILAGLHGLGVFFYFYWTVFWYDLLVHALVGVFLYLCLKKFFGERYSKIVFSLVSFLLISLIALLWELFEGFWGLTDWGSKETLFDVITDVLAVLLGGAILIFRDTIKRQTYVSKGY